CREVERLSLYLAGRRVYQTVQQFQERAHRHLGEVLPAVEVRLAGGVAERLKFGRRYGPLGRADREEARRLVTSYHDSRSAYPVHEEWIREVFQEAERRVELYLRADAWDSVERTASVIRTERHLDTTST